jgi:tRNA threonylcarbamoyladenosine biosynthesis protein TsaB
VVAAVDSRLGDWFCAVGAGEEAPFVASAGLLASRLDHKACLVIGTGVAALAGELVAVGVDALAVEALPDPLVLGRLAAEVGADTWRTRNEREGLPRPLYLRGVNITLPDGGRRTVD